MEEFLNKIKGILNGSADKTLLHNNANKPSERFPTQRDMMAGEVSKLLLKDLLPKEIWEAHNSGAIHFHDTDYSAQGFTNCCLVDLKGMLDNGTVIGNAEIETPKSISTAVAVTAQIIAQVSSHQYGGTSIDRLDEVLAPYVRKTYDKWFSLLKRVLDNNEAKAAVVATQLTEKAVYDAMQSLEYEVNTLFNSNGQSPFVTFGFGLGDSWESRLVQKSILEVRMKGLGASRRTAIFPKLVFVLKEGLNLKPDDPNYDIKQLAMKCTSERIYPDYISYEEVVKVTGDYKVSMGCRSFLSAIDSGETSGRNNLGVVSINLPRIAMEANSRGEFFRILKERIDLSFKALDWRIEHLKQVQAKSAPILYMHGAFGLRLKPEEYVFDHFINRSSISVGYIGCHEMLQAWFGKDVDTMHKDCIDFVKDVLNFMKDEIDKKKAESGIGFSLYATPSESLCDRFNRLDKEKFSRDFEWLFEKGYYTNSHHLSVDRKVSPDVKFDYESNFTPIASGGCISYVELPDMKKFPKALEYVIDYAHSKVHYFGINTPIDTCSACGYMGESLATEDGFKCPHCGNTDPNTLEVTRRVCGYLGNPGTRPFNPGKQNEVMGRVKHGNLNKQ
ncbi:anaerobic ribonucleoside reductase large subunit [Proteus phage J3S]